MIMYKPDSSSHIKSSKYFTIRDFRASYLSLSSYFWQTTILKVYSLMYSIIYKFADSSQIFSCFIVALLPTLLNQSRDIWSKQGILAFADYNNCWNLSNRTANLPNWIKSVIMKWLWYMNLRKEEIWREVKKKKEMTRDG